MCRIRDRVCHSRQWLQQMRAMAAFLEHCVAIQKIAENLAEINRRALIVHSIAQNLLGNFFVQVLEARI